MSSAFQAFPEQRLSRMRWVMISFAFLATVLLVMGPLVTDHKLREISEETPQ